MSRCITRYWILALWLPALANAAAARAENWPQWRGPNNDGISGETNLPAEFSATKNLAWKLPVPGQSGATPAIWKDRIFLSSQDGADIVLLCVSTEGKQLWKQKLGTGKSRFMRDEGNQASPSPSTDGQHVYAFAGTGDFACFDLDGKEIWRFNAQKRYGEFEIQHGIHVTPLLHGDRLYLSLLHSGAWVVIAIDKSTGKEVWKIERDSDAEAENEQAYASPCLWHRGKDEYLIVHGNDYTTAHRLSDGGEIWRLGDLNSRKRYDYTLRFVASPVATADLIVVPSAKRGPVVGLKPEAKGKIAAGSAFEQWRGKSTPDVSSPLIHNGLVYLCWEPIWGRGELICMDAQSGKEHYRKPLVKSRYRASPVYADGKIYVTARDGTITVVKPGPQFEALATNKLPDQLAASPAISGGRIYIRGFQALYAFSEGGK